jgi:hypothetical protein
MPLTLSPPWRLLSTHTKVSWGATIRRRLLKPLSEARGEWNVYEEVVWAFADGGVVDAGCIDDKSFDGRADDVSGQSVVAASGIA